MIRLRSIVIITISLSSCLSTYAQQWQELYDQSLKYYNSGNYTLCLQTAQDALKVVDSELSELFTLKILSTACNEAGLYNQGIEYGLRELGLYDNLEIADSVYANSLNTLSSNFMGAKQFQEAMIHLQELIEVTQRSFGSDSYEFGKSMSDLGFSFYMISQTDSALIYLDKANVILYNLEEGGEDYLYNLYTIGQIHYKSQDFSASAQSLKSLKEILEANHLQTFLLYAETCEGLGRAQYSNLDFEGAKQSLEMAAQSYEDQGLQISELPDLVNALSLAYLKLSENEKSDSVLTFIGTNSIETNVLINQLNQATEKFLIGELEESQVLLKDLEKKISPDTEETLLAEYYLVQAKVDIARGQNSDIGNLEKSLNIFQTHELPAKEAEVYLLMAGIYDINKNFNKATQSLEIAMKIIESNSGSPQLNYQIYRQLLRLYFLKADVAKARNLFSEISSDSKIMDSVLDRRFKYDFAILLQINGNNYESSIILAELRDSADPLEKTLYEFALARVLLDQDLFNEAESILEIIENNAIQNNEETTVLYGEVLSLKGQLFLNKGMYAMSEQYFEKGIKVLKNNPETRDQTMAGSYNSAAIYYQTVGNYKIAEEYYYQAQSFTTDGSQLSIDIVQNLGTLKQINEEYDEAIPLFEEALKEYSSLYGELHPAYAKALQNLSTAYQKTQRYEEAISLVEKAIEIDEANNLQTTISYSNKLNNLSVLYMETNEFDQAREIMIRVLKIRQKLLGESHPDYAFSIYNMAVLLHKMENYEEAKPYFDAMALKYQNQVTEFFPYLSEREKSAYYSKINGAIAAYQDFSVEYALKEPVVASDLLNFQLDNKAILLNSSVDIRTKIIRSQDTSLIHTYDEWLRLKERMIRLLSISEAERQSSMENVEELEVRANKLEKEISLRSREFSDKRLFENKSWRDIQAKLKPNEAAVEIFRVRKNIKNDSIWYVALIINSQTDLMPEMVVLNNGNELETRLFSLYKNNIRFKQKDTVSYGNYWDQIKEHLNDASTVYLAPDGIYNKININTLYNPDEQKYILEEISIRYLTNLNELEKKGQTTPIENPIIHLIGDPLFLMPEDIEAEAGPWIPPLPGTRQEIDSISHIMKINNRRFEVRTGENASEEYIKGKDNLNIIHIATHGFFLSDKDPEKEFYSIENNPLMRSGLLLAGSQKAFYNDRIDFNARPGKEDGVLTAYEVMNLDLRNTELVVLSACETGLGEVKNGEGVYGLQRSFIIAGAKSIIISLWKVDDEATKDLMVKFYKNLAAGNEKFESLAQAQREMMEKYNDPYYWGAFILSGI